ncbi:MAG TPA: sigma factor [Planctomycetota bacterium]|nr:sigma factor [Planctomycetota bacterium]
MSSLAEEVAACYPIAQLEARRILASEHDVDDVAQETVARALAAAGQMRGGSVKSYVGHAARHIALNVVARRRTRREAGVSVERMPVRRARDLVVDRELVAEVEATLAAMRPWWAAALRAVYLEGAKPAELAAARHWSPGTAWTAIYQAKQDFRRHWLTRRRARLGRAVRSAA